MKPIQPPSHLAHHQFTAWPSLSAYVSCHHQRGTSSASPGPSSTSKLRAAAVAKRGKRSWGRWEGFKG